MDERNASRSQRGAMRFAWNEGGTVSILVLFVLLIMLAAGGLAVDTMRHERERVRLQSTLDNAVLAAADLDQALDPATVVREHFDAAGLGTTLGGDIAVVERRHYRSVSAQASFDMPTILLHLAGVDSLPVPTAARAEEGADVEISLVLDVSSSMEGTKLRNLKAAAKEFVETVLPATPPEQGGGISTVSLVPYSMSVNIGAEMFELYNVVPNGTGGELVDETHCMLLDDVDFESTSFPPSRERRQLYLFDPQDGTNATGFTGYVNDVWPGQISTPYCEYGGDPATDRHLLVPLATNAATLTEAIDRIGPYKATGIDAGLRWGVTMLDPDTRPVIDALVASGTVEQAATGRPFDYGGRSVRKVVILMTDGEPDGQRDMHEALKDRRSNVFFDEVTGRYSVLLRGRYLAEFDYHPSERDLPGPSADHAACDADWPDSVRPDVADGVVRVTSDNDLDDDCAPVWYWIDHDPDQIADRWRGSRRGEFHDHPQTEYADPTEGDPRRHHWHQFGDDLRRLSYADLFREFTQFDAGEFLFREPRSRGWISDDERALLIASDINVFDTHTVDEAVDRMLMLCQAAKDSGVLIYTIAFELNNSKTIGRRLMRDCATSVGDHFFDVKHLEIAETFRTIAGGIGQLRLTR